MKMQFDSPDIKFYTPGQITGQIAAIIGTFLLIAATLVFL